MRKRKKTPPSPKRKGRKSKGLNQYAGDKVQVDTRDRIENFLRPYIVLLLVLPLSFLVTFALRLRRWWYKPKAAGHEMRVSRVVNAVKIGSTSGGKFVTNRDPKKSHSVRVQDKTQFRKVKMNDLQCILELKPNTVVVEPGVTVGEITKYLLQHDRILECTLEMEEATLGGLAMATGMTTHSHICGLIHDTIVAYKVVLGDGRLVHATENNEYSDLFDALPWSHGTLGLLVALELKTVPSKPYVKLVYVPYQSQEDYVQGYTHAVASSSNPNSVDKPFFLETIIFSQQDAVLMKGYLTDGSGADESTRRNNIGSYFKPWFFKHVQDICQHKSEVTEIIPIYDYLMRHDRSMSMTMAYVLPFGNHWLFRYTLGWLLPPNMSLLKGSHTTKTREQSARKQVYQDIGFPMKELKKMVNLSHDLFGIYPLLCYPCKISSRRGFLDVRGERDEARREGSQLFLNLGIYGVPKAILEARGFKTVLAVRELESIVRRVGGFQHTYCDSFQTESEFESMYNHKLWKHCRAKYGAAGTFPSIFEKTHPNDIDIKLWIEQEKQ